MNNSITEITDDFYSQYYIDILRQNEALEIDYYFDTQDIQEMIQGIRAVDSMHKIDKNKFNSNKLLVQALAFQEFFLPIHMLPPHQDEIAHYISNHHLLPTNTTDNLNNLINDLLTAVGLSRLDELPSNNLKEFIDKKLHEFKSQAISLFKANYLIFKPHWIERLKHLFGNNLNQNNLIKLNTNTFDIENLISSQIFIDIYKYFNSKRRANKTKANFRDAVALSILYNELELYKNKQTNRIPIFYSSATTISLINKNNKLKYLFCINVPSYTGNVSILRSEMFFILDFLFTLGRENEPYEELFTSINELKKKIGNGFEEIINISKLQQEIDNILSSEFFVTYWFEKVVREQLSQTIIDLINYDLFIDTPQKEEIIAFERKQLHENLSINLSKLKLIERSWEAFERIEKYVKKNLNKKQNKYDILLDFGLSRFSLIKCDDIQLIFDNIAIYSNSKDEKQNFYLLQAQIINYLVKGIYEKKLENLVVAISIFYIFEEYDLINYALNELNFKYGKYYQLIFFHASSIINSNQDTDTIINLISIAKNSFRYKNNYKVDIGLSFTYYQLWKIKHTPPLFPSEKNVINTDLEINFAIDHIKNAIKYLEIEKNKVKSEDRIQMFRKYYYSINNLLYYICRSNPHITINEIQPLVDELENVSTLPGKKYWQPRFAHTLAYAYSRFYLTTLNDKKRSKKYLGIAKRWMDEAKQTMPIIKPDYLKLSEFILVESAKYNAKD